MGFTKIHNVSQLITKDKSSASDRVKAKKEQAKQFRKPLSKMDHLKIMFHQPMGYKNELNEENEIYCCKNVKTQDVCNLIFKLKP